MKRIFLLLLLLQLSFCQGLVLHTEVESLSDSILIHWTWEGTVSPSLLASGEDLLITSPQALEVKEAQHLSQTPITPYVLSTSYGYDSFLLRLQKNAIYEVEQSEQHITITLHLPKAPQGAKQSLQDGLSFDLAKARFYLDNQNVDKGARLLETLHKTHPRNLDVLVTSAYAEVQQGRPLRALPLIDEARELSGGHEAIRTLTEELSWTHRPFSQLVQDVRHVSSESIEQRTGLHQAINLHHSSCLWHQLQFHFHMNAMKVRSAYGTDGQIRGFSKDRWYLRSDFIRRTNQGKEWVCSSYIGDFAPGFGFSTSYHQSYSNGVYGCLLELLSPNWDYLGSLVHRGTRSAIQADGIYRINRCWTISGNLGLQHYRVQNWGSVGNSLSSRGNLTVLLYEKTPQILASYSFDAEYGLHFKKRADQNGDPYDPLSFSSRELHSIIATLAYGEAPKGYGEIYIGYSQNRLGDGGPMGGARGYYRWRQSWETSLEWLHVLNSSGGGSSGSNVLNQLQISIKKRL